MMPVESLTTDVLILGAGAAGIRAALAAGRQGARVTLVCAGRVTGSGSTFSPHAQGWGMQALVADERSEEAFARFYDEILEAGAGCCDKRLVEILVRESGARWEDLLAFGLHFERGEDGGFLRVRGCFGREERAFVARMPQIRKALGRMARASGARIIRGLAVELLLSHGRCWGAWILSPAGDWIQAKARATILALGGGAAMFPDHLAHGHQSGEAPAMATRAGASLSNIAFLQFMLGVRNGDGLDFLPLQELGDEGRLVDEDGKDLLSKHIKDEETRTRALTLRKGHFPFSCRDESGLVDLAVARELRNGGQVFWERTGNGKQRHSVAFCCHAFNGGVRIDSFAQTTVPGLFAAGECAAGPHGADRVGGTMITATQVFGARAGFYAAREAKKKRPFPPFRFSPPEPPGPMSRTADPALFQALHEEARRILGRYLGVSRDKRGLQQCLQSLGRLEAELRAIPTTRATLPMAHRIRSLLETGRRIAQEALSLEGSLGSHFRADHPLQPSFGRPLEPAPSFRAASAAAV